MAYTKTTWQDRVVQNPLTYNFQNNADGTTTLLPAEGTITQAGTPITAAALNNLESQYDDAVAWAKSFGLGGDSPLISGQDLNTLNANGRFVGTNLTNAPSSDWFFIENTMNDTGTYQYQEAKRFTNGNDLFYRFNNAGTWTAWTRFILDTATFYTPVYQNGYANWTDSNYKLPLVTRMDDNLVVFEGLIKVGTPNTTAFTLPSGMAPSGHRVFPAASGSSGNNVQIFVNSNGTVNINGCTSNDWVSLNGISFIP